ncbi:MAG: CBS domain-containing protein [Gemmatimonadaceae bacterium]
MRLSDLLVPAHIAVPVNATTTSEAATALIGCLEASGAVQDAGKLRDRVAEERGEDAVSMGDRAFVMHYRTDAVSDLLVALGTSPEPLRRDSIGEEGQSARIALVVVAPPRLAAQYLQVLGAFARAFSNPAIVEEVLAAETAEEVASLPALRDHEVPAQLTVADIMTQRPRVTTPDTPLRDAAAVIARAGISALPVAEADGLLVGMLSERELVRHLLGSYLQGKGAARVGSAPQNRRSVRDAMTRQVLCVSPEQPLAEVASIMTNKDVDGVPVVRGGRVVGFLTRGDIIRKLIGY